MASPLAVAPQARLRSQQRTEGERRPAQQPTCVPAAWGRADTALPFKHGLVNRAKMLKATIMKPETKMKQQQQTVG